MPRRRRLPAHGRRSCSGAGPRMPSCRPTRRGLRGRRRRWAGGQCIAPGTLGPVCLPDCLPASCWHLKSVFLTPLSQLEPGVPSVVYPLPANIMGALERKAALLRGICSLTQAEHRRQTDEAEKEKAATAQQLRQVDGALRRAQSELRAEKEAHAVTKVGLQSWHAAAWRETRPMMLLPCCSSFFLHGDHRPLTDDG